jgi:hypothetical protein
MQSISADMQSISVSVSPHTTMCPLLLYMCPHTTIYVCSCYYMCPHTTIYVSSCYYMCPHTTIYVSSCYYMCPHTTIYVSSCYYICPHTTIYVSSYYCISRVLTRSYQQAVHAKSINDLLTHSLNCLITHTNPSKKKTQIN